MPPRLPARTCAADFEMRWLRKWLAEGPGWNAPVIAEGIRRSEAISTYHTAARCIFRSIIELRDPTGRHLRGESQLLRAFVRRREGGTGTGALGLVIYATVNIPDWFEIGCRRTETWERKRKQDYLITYVGTALTKCQERAAAFTPPARYEGFSHPLQVFLVQPCFLGPPWPPAN